MTRFDDPKYVTDWKQTGRFPAIHARIASAVREEVDPGSGPVLDLCSSTGLLGRQLVEHHYTVLAVQEPGPALELGVVAGVYDEIPYLELRITRTTLNVFLRWMEQQAVRTVVARRCFPELFDVLGTEQFPVLARSLHMAGVERIVAEGRVESGRTVHPLGSIKQEVSALAQHWKPVVIRGPIATLISR